MLSSFIFPYGITLKEDGRMDTFPAANVFFLNKKGEWISLFLIIDSGATISALPKSDASTLGIDLEKGRKMAISGIGNEILTGWQHEIVVRLGNETIQLPIVFLDREVAPRILGRAGIFGYFLLIFEENQRRTGFIKENQPEAQTIQKILDSINRIQ